MRDRFTVTYDITTHESAEHGDFAEIGFILPNGDHDALHRSRAYLDPRPMPMDLRTALDHVGGCLECSTWPVCYAGPGCWFTEIDGRENYQTGAHERRSLHPPKDITPASFGRLVRLLKARGQL